MLYADVQKYRYGASHSLALCVCKDTEQHYICTQYLIIKFMYDNIALEISNVTTLQYFISLLLLLLLLILLLVGGESWVRVAAWLVGCWLQNMHAASEI